MALVGPDNDALEARNRGRAGRCDRSCRAKVGEGPPLLMSLLSRSGAAALRPLSSAILACMTHDGPLDHAREFEEARATLAKLQAENDALHARAGEPLAARPESTLVSTNLGRELEETNLLIANLGIENAILESRARPARFPHGRALVRAAVLIIVGSGGAALWFETRSVGLLLAAALLVSFGWGMLWLFGVLKPTSINSGKALPDNLHIM
jgi:hypothetical protein